MDGDSRFVPERMKPEIIRHCEKYEREVGLRKMFPDMAVYLSVAMNNPSMMSARAKCRWYLQEKERAIGRTDEV